MKKRISLLLALVMMFTLVACAKKAEPAGEAVSFTVTVTDLEGNESIFEYTSSAATVGDALVAEGLIVGHQASYGFYVDTVNGITADWDNEQTYWGFYINGEYATVGIGDTPITADAHYGLVLTKL